MNNEDKKLKKEKKDKKSKRDLKEDDKGEKKSKKEKKDKKEKKSHKSDSVEPTYPALNTSNSPPAMEPAVTVTVQEKKEAPVQKTASKTAESKVEDATSRLESIMTAQFAKIEQRLNTLESRVQNIESHLNLQQPKVI
jgi:hypothetical protein